MSCENVFLKMPDVWTVLGLALAVIALFLYFLKFRIAPIIDIENHQIKVCVSNKNRVFNIHDLECEIVKSADATFRVVKTLTLVKSKTLILRPSDEPYIFKATNTPNNQKRSSSVDSVYYLRVRFAALNPIGVKKFRSYTCDSETPILRREA